MTLGEFKSRIRREFGETNIGNNPLNNAADPRMLDQIIIDASTTVAQRTECLYGPRFLSITANQKDYCVPGEVFRLKTAYYKDYAGDWQPIQSVGSPALMDSWTAVQWRNDNIWPAGDPPYAAVFSAASSVTLFPTPSVTRVGALAFEGFWKPINAWAWDSDGNPIPPDDAQECPLPEFTQDAVLAWAIYERGRRSRDPIYRALLPEYRIDRDEKLGDAIQASAQHHSTMVGVYGRLGWWWYK